MRPYRQSSRVHTEPPSPAVARFAVKSPNFSHEPRGEDTSIERVVGSLLYDLERRPRLGRMTCNTLSGIVRYHFSHTVLRAFAHSLYIVTYYVLESALRCAHSLV